MARSGRVQGHCRPSVTHCGGRTHADTHSPAHPRSPLTSLEVPGASTTYDFRDLRLHNGRDLRALLTEESRQWRARLRWDYTQSIQLLVGYLDSRILPGFVAIDRLTGLVHGYSFAVYETQKAVVGDLFSIHQQTSALDEALLHHLLPMLQHTPGVDRIESQLLLGAPELQAVFRESGFTSYRRLFMEAELPDPRELMPAHSVVRDADEPPPELPGNLKLRRWTAPVYQPAADLIHRAYAHHGDTEINDQYRTVQGCLRFLHNIVRFPGCGTFAPEHSFVLVEERSGELEGLILISRVEPETAHIPQLCISPRRRTRGLGQLLLRHAAGELARSGIRSLTLTVTEANTPALRLYQKLGFTTRHPFHANTWAR